MTVLIDHAAAVAAGVDEASVAGWDAAFDDMFAQVVAPAFFRREPRLRARSYLRGLVSGLERKNGWTLAEFAGDATPDGMQRLLTAARWQADAVRDALARYVAGRRSLPHIPGIFWSSQCGHVGDIPQVKTGGSPVPHPRSGVQHLPIGKCREGP